VRAPHTHTDTNTDTDTQRHTHKALMRIKRGKLKKRQCAIKENKNKNKNKRRDEKKEKFRTPDQVSMGATPTHELDQIRPRTEGFRGFRAARAEAGLETFSFFLAPWLVQKASRAHPVLSPIFQFRVSGLFPRHPWLVLSSLSSISGRRILSDE
jgi:hypothetical protein